MSRCTAQFPWSSSDCLNDATGRDGVCDECRSELEELSVAGELNDDLAYADEWGTSRTFLGGAVMAARVTPTVWYDYENQAWVSDGRYAKCGHRQPMVGCYACHHAGENCQVSRRSGV